MWQSHSKGTIAVAGLLNLQNLPRVNVAEPLSEIITNLWQNLAQAVHLIG